MLAALLPNFDQIYQFLVDYGYFALVFMLLIAGMGVPIPEDIPLILSGYLTTTGTGGASLTLMIVAGMAGVLLGDSVIFFIGRHGINSNNFVARHIQKVMTPKRLAWAEKHFAKHGNLTVFAGRFMPGFRAVVFAMAGAARMTYLRFVLVNGLAAAVSVPAWIILGHYLAVKIPRKDLESKIEEYKHIILPVLLGVAVLVALYLLIRFLRRKKLQKAAEAAAAVTADKTALPAKQSQPSAQGSSTNP